MIKEYHRPTSFEEALALLGRAEPPTLPLAGGSALNRPSAEEFAVVDLQALRLDGFQARGNFLELGATLSLQNLLEELRLAKPSPAAALEKAIEHEATNNLRQVASVAGTLVAAGGRSPFTTALLALDARLTVQPGDEQASLGDLLPFRQERLRGRLITQVSLPSNARLAYEYVARTPADLPIVCAALAIWPSGRRRLALGGYGAAPVMAFDGGEAEGVQVAAQSAYSEAGDQWASAEYRQEIAGVLAKRCLEQLT
ncbi:MAG: FAD binding domain-containing protein [Anaerolineales bacterium]|nr:FAD binding domain-containing protein [Anaerolineales bacterium]